jgi:hypothetical protein
MILYGLALAPLAKEIREAVPGAMQAWYADNCAMAGETVLVAEGMSLLERLGTAHGYFPEPMALQATSKRHELGRARRRRCAVSPPSRRYAALRTNMPPIAW